MTQFAWGLLFRMPVRPLRGPTTLPEDGDRPIAPRSEAPLVLVTPVKRPPGEMPYVVRSPLGQMPHAQNCFCLFSLGLCFVSICFLMRLYIPIPFCTFPYGFFGASVTNVIEL